MLKKNIFILFALLLSSIPMLANRSHGLLIMGTAPTPIPCSMMSFPTLI